MRRMLSRFRARSAIGEQLRRFGRMHLESLRHRVCQVERIEHSPKFCIAAAAIEIAAVGSVLGRHRSSPAAFLSFRSRRISARMHEISAPSLPW
jgi:hypothetical protein